MIEHYYGMRLRLEGYKPNRSKGTYSTVHVHQANKTDNLERAFKRATDELQTLAARWNSNYDPSVNFTITYDSGERVVL